MCEAFLPVANLDEKKPAEFCNDVELSDSQRHIIEKIVCGCEGVVRSSQLNLGM